MKLPFVLPDNVTIDELNSPLVEVDPGSGDVTVRLWRSTPSIENVELEENLMWDGRFGSDLELQVLEAVKAHYEPGRLPTDEELADIAFYQSSFFTNKALDRYARGPPPPDLPKVPSGVP